MQTYLQKITQILKRPSFWLLSDIATTTLAYSLIVQSIKDAEEQMYETYRLTDPHYEKDAFGADGLALPAGTQWGASGKVYKLDAGTTPALPSDVMRAKKLWIEDTTTHTPYGSSSTYDTDTGEGTGIPADASVLTASNVFHEFIGDTPSTGKLKIYVGNTAAGASPKAHFTYARSKTAYVDTSNVLDVPEALLQATFDGIVNQFLQFYLGIS